MSGVVVDTHALIWYMSASASLSAPARNALEQAVASGAGIGVSAISLVEIQYLVEKGRVPQAIQERFLQLLAAPDPPLRLVPLDEAVARCLEQVPRDQVPDMPDRIIAATAVRLGLPLVSRDRKIQTSTVRTIW